MPAIHLHVSSAFRVRVQDAIDDREEVKQPSLLEGGGDRGPAFADTQMLAVHVRVGRFGTGPAGFGSRATTE